MPALSPDKSHGTKQPVSGLRRRSHLQLSIARISWQRCPGRLKAMLLMGTNGIVRPQKLGLDQENHEKKSKHALHARSLFHVVNAFWQKLLDSSKPAHVMNLGYSNIKCHLNHHIHQLLQTCRVALLTLLDDPLHLIIGVVEQGSVSH